MKQVMVEVSICKKRNIQDRVTLEDIRHFKCNFMSSCSLRQQFCGRAHSSCYTFTTKRWRYNAARNEGQIKKIKAGLRCLKEHSITATDTSREGSIKVRPQRKEAFAGREGGNKLNHDRYKKEKGKRAKVADS